MTYKPPINLRSISKLQSAEMKWWCALKLYDMILLHVVHIFNSIGKIPKSFYGLHLQWCAVHLPKHNIIFPIYSHNKSALLNNKAKTTCNNSMYAIAIHINYFATSNISLHGINECSLSGNFYVSLNKLINTYLSERFQSYGSFWKFQNWISNLILSYIQSIAI